MRVDWLLCPPNSNVNRLPRSRYRLVFEGCAYHPVIVGAGGFVILKVWMIVIDGHTIKRPYAPPGVVVKLLTDQDIAK